MSSVPNASSGEVIVHVFGRTDVGRTREHNEDAFVVADLSADNATLQPEVRTHVIGRKGSMFMVADGMGGAAAGEIASAMAIDIVLTDLRTSWLTESSESPQDFVRAIKRATKAANEQINSFAGLHAELRGMGTTATIAGVFGDTLYLAQVGDSRAYLVRGGIARQITKDQSLMQKLIEAGELTEEEAARSERRNIILQALGPEPTIKIDLTHQVVRRGDTLVLCSDGLSGQVTKDEIAQIVTQETDLTVACKRLIDRANENGGPDNITVIVARFDGSGLRGPEADDEVGHRVFPLPDTGQTAAVPMDRPANFEAPSPSVATPEFPRSGERTTSPTVPTGSATIPENLGVHVSASRRHTGRLIQRILLVILVLGAVWFVVRHVRVSPGPNSTSSPTP